MNTCDKCKHFSPIGNDQKFGECELMGDWNDNEPAHEDRAYGWDEESRCAGVYVMHKFGCIHFEQKE